VVENNFLGIKNIKSLKHKLDGSSLARMITEGKSKYASQGGSPNSNKHVSAESLSSYYGKRYPL